MVLKIILLNGILIALLNSLVPKEKPCGAFDSCQIDMEAFESDTLLEEPVCGPACGPERGHKKGPVCGPESDDDPEHGPEHGPEK